MPRRRTILLALLVLSALAPTTPARSHEKGDFSLTVSASDFVTWCDDSRCIRPVTDIYYNRVDGLLFHIDSGLAGEAAFGAPRPTLDYVGIPVPEVSVQEGFVGGGGGGFATGTFEIAELGLGSLRQAGLKGSFGALPPQSYQMLGFIEDGLISHNFVRKYAWTLDFERMVMVFSS